MKNFYLVFFLIFIGFFSLNGWCSEEISVDKFGIEYWIPNNSQIKTMNASASFSLGSLKRYPSKEQNWKEMTDAKAYLHDAMVGQWTSIRDAQDENFW